MRQTTAAVSRQDIAEIYFAHATQAIRDELAGVEGALERFEFYNRMGFKWQEHHEWVEARRPKRAVPEPPITRYMNDA